MFERNWGRSSDGVDSREDHFDKNRFRTVIMMVMRLEIEMMKTMTKSMMKTITIIVMKTMTKTITIIVMKTMTKTTMKMKVKPAANPVGKHRQWFLWTFLLAIAWATVYIGDYVL